MATPDERRALAFLAALALIAAGVRVVGVHRFEAETRAVAGGAAAAPMAQRALDHQLAAIDSARQAPKTRKRTRTSTPKTGASSRVRDGPTLVERAPTEKAPRHPAAPLDINGATAQQLERLPRIGPALAQRIVAWREAHGPFASLDDLRHVRGIGPSTVRLLDTLVTFSARHSP